MKYKLTLTNEIGEVLDYWHVRNEDIEIEENGVERQQFNLDVDDDKLDLIDEISGAASRAETADQEQQQELYRSEFWKSINSQTNEFKKSEEK